MDSEPARKKLKLNPADNDSQDIISNLPEDILSHILSFLPTKDAVRTSVLSTKWIYKWTCITNLDVDNRLIYSKKTRTRKSLFINFMNRAMRDASPHVSNDLPLFGSLVSLDMDMDSLFGSQDILFIFLRKSPVLERLSFSWNHQILMKIS
ncbi:hypothetical protein L6164_020997 [Bauhinia variegata]|uniref:Uncharacterized protein n=1 Tax=Bauhinia variegata TaxID=167791 RepID=A0ACB9MYB2_BAUVA|nr:hypothetical protein L6164_020997 [Bauhinia variegata]